MALTRWKDRTSDLWTRIRNARAELHASSVNSERIRQEMAGASLRLEESLVELAACRREIAEVQAQLSELSSTAATNHSRAMLALRMVRDDDASSRAALWSLRRSDAYEQVFEEDEPLVTIIVTTYLNWPLLRDRCLPSIVAQSYERWEVIVVGDAAPDEAGQVVRSFGDERIQFVNLPYRGPYPEIPFDAWLVSGSTPWNTGLALAHGSWIGSNSDDDALRPAHIESLLKQARNDRAEVAYGYINQREPDGPGTRLGVFPPVHGQWGTQSSLIHAGLRFLPLHPSDWVFGIANDVSLLERMLRIGVRFSMLEEEVVDYYPSQLWSDREERLTRRQNFY